MGVHGLWELLAPVGRRVSVETLAGKKLAIVICRHASIWMIQFMKAMRDEKGEMVRNAHILGFFRRICKLLYLRTKPVFVFDGGTPALKRRTVIARRRQRENAQAKIRKTAEKLLLNHLKAMKLKELAADLERQRQNNDVKGKKPILEEYSIEQNTVDKVGRSYNQEELDEMLAASLAVEENEDFTADASASGARLQDDEIYGDGDEDEDEDEEIILPEIHGKVDPAVLAALPPSMQLDLLVQMREKLMAENRQKYQKVKKAPARFSELQIQAYLKTVAFRREIDGVQKAAAGKGIGGVQTSRIASEASREFIFSSSFTGDKQSLASTGKERTKDGENDVPMSSRNTVGGVPTLVNSSSNVVNEAMAKQKFGVDDEPTAGAARKAYHDDVETYMDERGRLRVSRVRALGIRMTRDLQRNLDLMKEIEQEKAETTQNKSLEKAETNQNKDNDAEARNLVDVPENSFSRVVYQEITGRSTDVMNDAVDKSEEPSVLNGTSIEISFEDINKHEHSSEEDTLFASLIAGEPVMEFHIDDPTSAKQCSGSSSDCEWEEGVVEDKSKWCPSEGGMSNQGEIECPSEGGMSNQGEIEWEDGSLDIQFKPSYCSDENQLPLKKGDVEEESKFQEAIRRSLEDMIGHGSSIESQKIERCQYAVGDPTTVVSFDEVNQVAEVESSGMDASQSVELTRSVNILESGSVEAISSEFVGDLHNEKSDLDPRFLNQDGGSSRILVRELFVASNFPHEPKDVEMTTKPLKGIDGEGDSKHAVNQVVDSSSGEVAHDGVEPVVGPSSITDSQPKKLLDSVAADVQQVFQAAIDDHSSKDAELGETLAYDLVLDSSGTRELTKEKFYGEYSIDNKDRPKKSLSTNNGEKHEVGEDNLDEEILHLDQECEELVNEQRKLERNAESVSSEMFAECQELLQMFGLPYIIAPMEAEAQCSYMEISNMVDGVVTDDSDAFLFGARTVYKNIFDDRKYVETYLMKDIEDELGLDREKLIRMALLLGSDYTEGVSGIGIVNAIEVVNAFPEKDGLREFREWIESPDPTILGKLDGGEGSSSKRKGSKGGETTFSGQGGPNVPESGNDAGRIKQVFMDKHRNVSKNWHISSTFPSDAVISAYASPQVDKSTEPFSWGKPDLFVLRKVCWEKFGWGASKADEVLLPVLKEYNKHETQLRLEAFYTFNERFAKIRSKRIKKAVRGITGDKSSKMVDETDQHSGSGKKRKRKPSEDQTKQSEEDSSKLDYTGTSHQREQKGKKTGKQLNTKRAKDKVSGMNLEHPTSVDSRPNSGKESCKRGGQLRRGGKKKKSSCDGDSDSSQSDGICDEGSIELQPNRPEESPQLRRSGRNRRTVNYTVSDELDDIDEEAQKFLNTGSSPLEPFIEDTAIDGNEFTDTGKRVMVDDGNEPTDTEKRVMVDDGNEFTDTEKRVMVDETLQAYMEENMDDSRIHGSQSNDYSKQSESSKDYLQFGGGFCAEEDENGMELDERTSSPTRAPTPEAGKIPSSNENPSNIIIPDSTENETMDLMSKTQTDVNYSLPDENFVSLRAMPNLRRKKRKT